MSCAASCRHASPVPRRRPTPQHHRPSTARLRKQAPLTPAALRPPPQEWPPRPGLPRPARVSDVPAAPAVTSTTAGRLSYKALTMYEHGSHSAGSIVYSNKAGTNTLRTPLPRVNTAVIRCHCPTVAGALRPECKPGDAPPGRWRQWRQTPGGRSCVTGSAPRRSSSWRACAPVQVSRVLAKASHRRDARQVAQQQRRARRLASRHPAPSRVSTGN